MGYKRKRESYREQRPRLSPTELLIARVRPAIAQIGEPSRYAREGLMRGLVHDLGEVPESNFGEVLQTIQAVIYEQPHKIGYLAYVIAAAPSSVSFIVLEMAHDETHKAIQASDLARFKLFFRFLCALHPVIANTEVLTSFIQSLVSAQPSDQRLKTELFKIALLASLYLPPHLISEELRDLFSATELTDGADDSYDFYTGDEKPYKTRYLSTLLPEAVKQLKESNWDPRILAANPLIPVQKTSESSNSLEQAAVDSMADADNNAPEASEMAQEPKVAENVDDNTEENYQPAEPKTEKSTNTGEDHPEEEQIAEVKNSEGEKAAKEQQSEEKKHALRPLHLPDPLSFNGSYSPAFFRCYFPLEEKYDTVPSEETVQGILLRDIAIDVMRHMDFNRREVTRQLIALDVFFNGSAFAPPGAWLDQISAGAQEEPPKPTWKVEDIALEAVFSQMFDLENLSRFPLVYYHSLLIEACVMAPQDIAPVLGRGIRNLFTNLESIDAELFFRIIDWFSHHVSNFAFTWKWKEWTDALSLPEDHPKLVFIKNLLSKEVRLSYPQRVRDVLPEEFQPLVPEYPDVPVFKYSDDKNAEKLVEALQSGNLDEAKEALNACSESTGEQIAYLVHTICHLGNRSITHVTTWITKCETLLQSLIPVEDQEAANHLLEAVFEHWSDARWVGSLVIDQFIKANLLKSEFVVKFVIGNQYLLLSSVGWEIIKKNPQEAQKSFAGFNLNGSHAEWWRSRLEKAISRIADNEQRQKKQTSAEFSEDRSTEVVKAGDNDNNFKVDEDQPHQEESTAASDANEADAPSAKRQKNA